MAAMKTFGIDAAARSPAGRFSRSGRYRDCDREGTRCIMRTESVRLAADQRHPVKGVRRLQPH